MDSRKTMPGGGGERNDENVVRLQRDWLGPREELVPMGSRAGTAEAPDDTDTAALPPTAASFWDEDSGSLQAPMRAPADAWPGRWEPGFAHPADGGGPVSQPASERGGRSLPGLPGFSRFSGLVRLGVSSVVGGWRAPRGRRRAIGAVGILAACVLAAVAVIGATEGGVRTARMKTARASPAAPIVTATGVNRARLEAHIPGVPDIRTEPAIHHRRPARLHRHRTVVSTRHPHRAHVSTHRSYQPSVSRSAPSVSQPVHTTTTTYTPAPTVTAPSTGSTSSATPRARSTSASQQQSAFGSSGALGPGRSSDS